MKIFKKKLPPQKTHIENLFAHSRMQYDATKPINYKQKKRLRRLNKKQENETKNKFIPNRSW